MKEDKSSERRGHDECSCSETETQNSENEDKSDGWQTMQEEDCCSCCSASEPDRKDDNVSDASNRAEEGKFSDCCEKYACKGRKNSKKGKASRTREVGAGECSRAKEENDKSYEECRLCQGVAYLQEEEQCAQCDTRCRKRKDENSAKTSCSCVGVSSRKTHGGKRSRTRRRKLKRGKKNGNCSCPVVVNEQQCADCCTCLEYRNRSDQRQEASTSNVQTVSTDCQERCGDGSGPEVRYSSVSCQTCQNEETSREREAIILPRVSLRSSMDNNDCEQCLRERTMFDRLSDQAVRSTIDETFKKLIRKTLEMYPAPQRAGQQGDSSPTNQRPMTNTTYRNLLQQPSFGLQLCTCVSKTCNQNDAEYTGFCTECEEVSPNCACEECVADSQGNESCEECAKEARERSNTCINEESNETCAECASGSDDDNDVSDTCCECCKCQCWMGNKPSKDDDFLY